MDSVGRQSRMTYPRWGEVDLLLAMRSIVQCKSGEGAQVQTRDRNPSPQPSPYGRGSAASFAATTYVMSKHDFRAYSSRCRGKTASHSRTTCRADSPIMLQMSN